MNDRRRRAVAVGGLVVGVVALAVFALPAAFDGGSVASTTIPAEVSLSEAVAAGDTDFARALLDDGADPDEPRVQGFTPLMRAAVRDDASMVRLLLDAGADPEATDFAGLTASHVAAGANTVAALEVLIAAGADLGVRSRDGMNTLEHAAAAGSVDAITQIAATGVDLDAHSEIVTQGHGYPEDIGSTALGIAARAGHVGAVTRLLELGAQVDAPSALGRTPLLMAVVSGGSAELISVLLEAGADPTVRAECRARCAYEEGDVLEWARRIGNPEVVPLLEAALDE